MPVNVISIPEKDVVLNGYTDVDSRQGYLRITGLLAPGVHMPGQKKTELTV